MDSIYQFNKEEWDYLIKLYNKHESLLPVFLQDILSMIISKHNGDKRICNETELKQLITFIIIVRDYYSSDSYEQIIKEHNNSKDFIEEYYEQTKLMNEMINILTNVSYTNEIRRMTVNEGREDEY